jgi:hypothetical protein
MMLPGQSLRRRIMPARLVAQGEPFQISINNIPGQPGGFANLQIDVPEGKTLVIRSASVRVRVPPGQAVQATLSANGPSGVLVGTQYFVLALQGTFGGFDILTGNHSMLLWVGGGGAVFNFIRSDVADLMSAEGSAVGFFLP